MSNRFLKFGLLACLALFGLPNIEAKAGGYICDKELKSSKGLSIEGEPAENLTKKELLNLANEHLVKVNDYNVFLTLSDTDNKAKYKSDKLKLKLSDDGEIDKALEIGNRGNLLQKISQKNELLEQGKEIDLRVATDENTVKDLIEKSAKKLNRDALDGSLKRVNGEFIVQEGKTGYEIDVAQATDKLFDFINNDWDDASDIELELPSKITKPRGTKEELSKVKDLLGTATTFYSAGGSRGRNLANGASKINGSLVYPNETFSVYQAVQPFTADNGYFLAGTYENGTVINSYGGGICQVSSTLYNAALGAELEIVERSCHSMIVTYLEPSKDAAIAGTYKDFKFKNNGEYPIYVEGYASGGKLKFDIYGYETRPKDRTVKYVSEVLSTTEPGVKYVEVDKPIGYKKVVQSAHVGHTARLIKVVTENGVEKREEINKSTYRASPRIVEIGVKSDVDGANEELVKALKTKDEKLVESTMKRLKDKAEKKKDDSAGDEDYDDDDWTDGSEE